MEMSIFEFLTSQEVINKLFSIILANILRMVLKESSIEIHI